MRLDPRFGVVVAHPDDETLGAGGAIARMARAGHRVDILCIADGELSRLTAGEDDVKRREWQGRAAATALGAASISFRRLPDQKLDIVPLLTISRTIEEWIAMHEPTRILTHSTVDLNADHAAVARATQVAARPRPGRRIESLCSFETPSATEWGFGRFGEFRPDSFLALDEAAVATKCRALACYDESPPWPHPRSEESIRLRLRYWGSMVGLEYAEPYETVWVIA